MRRNRPRFEDLTPAVAKEGVAIDAGEALAVIADHFVDHAA
jgi:hypothetical protein